MEAAGVPLRLRTGRKVGRTIYRQLGAVPSDDDPLIGVMDTADWAALVVDAFNRTEWTELGTVNT